MLKCEAKVLFLKVPFLLDSFSCSREQHISEMQNTHNSAIIAVMGNSILNRQFRYTYSNMCLVLICINIFTFFLTEFAFPQLKVILSMSPLYVMVNHSYWSFFTYMFVHGSIMHLRSNMCYMTATFVCLS